MRYTTSRAKCTHLLSQNIALNFAVNHRALSRLRVRVIRSHTVNFHICPFSIHELLVNIRPFAAHTRLFGVKAEARITHPDGKFWRANSFDDASTQNTCCCHRPFCETNACCRRRRYGGNTRKYHDFRHRQAAEMVSDVAIRNEMIFAPFPQMVSIF